MQLGNPFQYDESEIVWYDSESVPSYGPDRHRATVSTVASTLSLNKETGLKGEGCGNQGAGPTELTLKQR